MKDVSLGAFEAHAETKKAAKEKLEETITWFSKVYEPYRVYPGLGDVKAFIIAPRLCGGWSYGFLREGEPQARLLCLMVKEEHIKKAAVAHVFEMYGDLDDESDLEWLQKTCKTLGIEHAVYEIKEDVADLIKERKKYEKVRP